MAMRQICHAGQMLLGLTDILARKEGAFGQASFPNLTVITLLRLLLFQWLTLFFVLLVGIHFETPGFSLGGLPGYDASYPYRSCSNFSSFGHCNRGRFLYSVLCFFLFLLCYVLSIVCYLCLSPCVFEICFISFHKQRLS